MSFLSPLMFWFALLLPAIIVLYLLKLKRQHVVVPSLLLWRKSIDDMKANAPFQRLRNNLLMWLQLLILALLVFALARPMIQQLKVGGKELIALIDTSASMKATDVKPSRLDLAKEAALKLVRDMGRGDSMMLISFGGQTSVRSTLSSDKALLRRAVDKLKATDERTGIRDAMAIAASVAKTSPTAEVLILSDGRIEDLADVPSAPSKVTFVPIGKGSHNAAVTAFEIRQPVADQSTYSAFVKVDYFGDAPAATVLKLTNNEQLSGARELKLKPGASQAVTFEDVTLEKGVVSAAIELEDDLAADNAARCVLTPRRRIEVLLVAEENYFLEKALTLEREVSLTKAAPGGYQGPQGYDVVIFDGWRPPALPDGNYLFLGALPPLEAFKKDGEVAAPLVLDWDQTHPLSRFVTFSGMNVSKAMNLKLSQGAKALVESKRTPLMATFASGRRRVVVVGFDVYDSDWPLRVSFPLFVSNAVHWLADRRSGVVTEKYATGQAVAIPTSKTATAAEVTDPAGRTHEVTLDAMKTAYFSQTQTVGLYQLHVRDEQDLRKPIAVNLLSSEESNTAPAKGLAMGKRTIAASPEGIRTNQEIWRYFALVAVVAMLAEWYFYCRRAWL